MKDFGKKLKELRQKNNESQKELAEKLNITFQSISKWEQGMHFPDVFMVKKIADYYNVDINYFFDMKQKNKEVEIFEVKSLFNEKGLITTWTDFEYNNKIAPISFSSNERRRAGNGLLKHQPGPKDYLIICVNEFNEICYIGKHENNRFPTCSPTGIFYSKSMERNEKNPCFILDSDYKPNQIKNKQTNDWGYEFVIPENGFIINIPVYSIEAKKVLTFIVPNHLKSFINDNYPNLYRRSDGKLLLRDMIFPNELDDISVQLENDKIIFYKEVEKDDYSFMNANNINVNTNNNLELLNMIKKLDERLMNLEIKIDEIDDEIDDMDYEYDNSYLENRISELEEKIEKLENEILKLKKI